MCATLGLASNVCGSVFGLLSIAVTVTYLPPIWEITFAYSFSAPTAVIGPFPVVLPTALAPQPAAATATTTAAASDRNIGRIDRRLMTR